MPFPNPLPAIANAIMRRGRSTVMSDLRWLFGTTGLLFLASLFAPNSKTFAAYLLAALGFEGLIFLTAWGLFAYYKPEHLHSETFQTRQHLITSGWLGDDRVGRLQELEAKVVDVIPEAEAPAATAQPTARRSDDEDPDGAR